MIFKKILILVLVLNLTMIFSQEKLNLRDLLFKSVNPCYSNLLEVYEEGEKITIFDGKVNVDDSANGYLSVSGQYPTCGCYCSNIAGGYKQANGNYTILVNEEWSCETKSVFHSNKNLVDIFPKGFGINDFIPQVSLPDSTLNTAVFKLNVEIPRKGTDTKVSLKLIPFGVNQESKTVLTNTYEENLSRSKYIYGIKTIIKNLKDQQTINFLISNQIEQINTLDLKTIEKEIDLDNSIKFKNITEISTELKKLKSIYNLYKTIKYQHIILGWDKTKSQFYIKKKVNSIDQISFKDFILTNLFWRGPSC